MINKNKNNKINQGYNISISSTQLKNPIVKDFFFGYNTDTEMNCDFKVSDKYFCFFLSLKYHHAFPCYIQEKFSKFTENVNNISITSKIHKYLFCMLDLEDEVESIEHKLNNNQNLNLNFNLSCNELDKIQNIFNINNSNEEENINLKIESKLEKLLIDLNFICLDNNIALVLCYSGYDLAQYIYSLSQMENSNYGEDKIRALNLEENILETLCMIEKINKTDATNLISNLQDIKSILTASSNLLNLVPGMNKKIKSIEDFMEYDFKNFNKNN